MTTNLLMPLRYLIGTDDNDPGQDGYLTVVSYDSTRKPSHGTGAKYINLFVEKYVEMSRSERKKYAPFLTSSSTAQQYGEGQCDPAGDGFWLNLKEQLARAKLQGFTLLGDVDNRDAYRNKDVLKVYDTCQSLGFSVICKNPGMSDYDEDSTPLVKHPAVVGIIVEKGDIGPGDIQDMRHMAGKPDLPVWFVSFMKGRSDGKTWADATAAQIKKAGYTNMWVSYSSDGEYASSAQIGETGGVAARAWIARDKAAAYWIGNKDTTAAVSNFDVCLPLLLASEGGNDSDPRDPGGRTSRGVTQSEYTTWRKTHPGLPSDVWQAPQETVAAIYKQNYWDAMRCGEMPSGVDYAAWDFGVNSGISRSAQFLQRLVGVNADGKIGPISLAAISKADATSLVVHLCDQRLAWLRTLSTYSVFGNGWKARVERVKRDAGKMVATKPPVVPPGPPPVPPPSPILTKGLLDPAYILSILNAHGCVVETSPHRVNIFYLEGVNLDGTRNSDALDKWNDVRGVLQFVDGAPRVTFYCVATTCPGKYYDSEHIIGEGPKGTGAALIAPGQQFCWQCGQHRAGSASAHEALVQTGGEVVVFRDYDRSFTRKPGSEHRGNFGINEHSAPGGFSPSTIGSHSAGCLVAPNYKDHQEWMRLCKTDERYQSDHSYVFGTVIIPVSWQVAAIR